MGRLSALRLGITKGKPSWTPICPNRHDVESLTRIAQQSKVVRLLDRGASGAMDLVIVKAVAKHAELCNPAHPKEYCDCPYCVKVQENRNGND